MLHSIADPETHFEAEPPRNPWAVVDLIVFAVFFLALLLLITPLAHLPVVYAIPLQGLFNITLVGFIAGWVRVVRHGSFIEYVHFFRSPRFPIRQLILLGAVSSISVLIISAFLPSTTQTPLEKLLTTRNAILMFAIFGVAVAPLLEEIIFRGFIFKVLLEIGSSRISTIVTDILAALAVGRLAGDWRLGAATFVATSLLWQIGGPASGAVVFSAALFAILHAGQLAGNWGGVLLIFLVGCVLSVVRHRTNSIIPSFVVHTTYNSTLFLLFAISSAVQKFAK
jgi:membrane protease YdiL (CAAX protease family)